MSEDDPKRRPIPIDIRAPVRPEGDAPPSDRDTAAGGDGSKGRGPSIPAELPLLPLRNTVVFPGMVAPLSVGRPSSVKMLSESLPHSKIIGIIWGNVMWPNVCQRLAPSISAAS